MSCEISVLTFQFKPARRVSLGYEIFGTFLFLTKLDLIFGLIPEFSVAVIDV